jgi:hypothetical protein
MERIGLPRMRKGDKVKVLLARRLRRKTTMKLKASKSALFILELLCLLPLATLADQDVQTRFDTSLKNARSITNVEIRMLDTLWLKEAPVEPNNPKPAMSEFHRTSEYSCAVSGEKYRGERRLISAPQTNMAQLVEAAFDGTTYFSYDADNRYMTRKTGNSTGDNVECPFNPLIAPFLFLTRQTDGCINCILRFSDILSPAFTSSVILPEAEKSDGLLEINLTGLPLMKQPTFWKIVLDQKGDSFTPKTMTWVEAGAETVLRLLDYTNLGAYQFPSVIVWSTTAYPATSPTTVMGTGMVTMISVRVPKQIPDSTFRLDEKSAATIWDWDQKTFSKERPRLVTSYAKGKDARYILLTMILLAILCLWISIWKRSASRRS